MTRIADPFVDVIEERKEAERAHLTRLLMEALAEPDAGELTRERLDQMLAEARRRNRERTAKSQQ